MCDAKGDPIAERLRNRQLGGQMWVISAARVVPVRQLCQDSALFHPMPPSSSSLPSKDAGGGMGGR